MNKKARRKRNIFLITAVFAVFLSLIMSNSFIETLANPEEAEQQYNSAVNDYIGDAEDSTEILDKMMTDMENNKDPERNSIYYVINRLFSPGAYLNDVRDGVIDTDLGVSKSEILTDGKHACNPLEKNNLLNHNCNIPNFTTSLFQNVMSPWMVPFNNAGKTSARSAFGLGVPNGIPNDEVPVNPGQREHTYTALELYGYDLKLTSYNGEWDQITVSTKAKMLSNFGLIDHTKLLGTALWESAQSGIANFIEGFNFTSDRFGRPISGLFDGFASAGLNVITDTKDLNVFSTKAWKREKLNDTLYNVYVLTDKEVITETAKTYYKKFLSVMKGNAAEDEKLNLVLELNPDKIPTFMFKEDWETEESIKAREEAKAHNAAQDIKASTSRKNAEDYDNNMDVNYGMGLTRPIQYIPSYVEVPEPIYYTESEQLVFWAEDPKNSSFLQKGQSQGLFPENLSELTTFEELLKDWSSKWEVYYTREFAAANETIQDLLKKSDKDLYVDNPYLDSRQAISHYVCANEYGLPMRDSSGNLEYLYTGPNVGSKESINPKCEAVRSPIGGGLFGNGWHIDRPVDTRHIHAVDNEVDGGTLFKTVTNMFQSIFRSINSFVAKVTNVILGLSFSPILSEIGLDKVITKLVVNFRDTIFFPMSILAAAVGGLLLFFQILKNGSAWQLVTSVFATFLIFILGAMFLLRPNVTLNLADKWPVSVDNFLADIILSDDDGSTYCSTGTESNSIRSAQCNVWGAMVFNPWVQLQFGTGYDDLYARGYAQVDGKEMKNSSENEKLVGNAAVNMGNDVVVNNWALYQLSKTKTGTITHHDSSNSQSLGKVDKDLYRLVDLQAGPNNGEGTDSRFFSSWSGGANNSGNVFVMILTTIQAIVLSITIIGLGFTKIETSFMFAMSLVIAPIMLLYALLPKGKARLKSYLSSLLSLFIKRITVTIILGVFLKLINGIYASSSSLTLSAITTIILSVTFIMYKKDLMELITSTEGGLGQEVKEAVVESVPQELKQRYQLTKANVKGLAAGAVGGVVGASSYNKDKRDELKDVRKDINSLRIREKKGNISEVEIDNLIELQVKEKTIMNIIEEDKKSGDNNVVKGAIRGAKSASSIIGRRTERQIRRSGFSPLKIKRQAEDEVVAKGQSEIIDNEAPMESDVYRDILSTGDTSQNVKTSQEKINKENAALLLNKNVQKIVREEAKKRRKLAEEEKERNAISIDELDLNKVRDIVEAKRQSERAKNMIVKRNKHKERKEIEKHQKDSSNITSSTKDIKEQIIKKQNEKGKSNDNKPDKEKSDE